MRTLLETRDNEPVTNYRSASVMMTVDSDTEDAFTNDDINIMRCHPVGRINAGPHELAPSMFGYLVHNTITYLLSPEGGRITLISRSESAMAAARLAILLDIAQERREHSVKVEMYMASEDWSTLTDCNIFENHQEDSEET